MYAAEVKASKIVRVIVGDSVWSAEILGGQWVDSPTKVGIGWPLVDGEIVPPEPDPTNIEDE
jgi:hypothetical protein